MWVEEKISGGKLLCISATCTNHKISSIKISGDFFIHPEESILNIESCFLNLPIPPNEEDLRNKLQKATSNVLIIGFTIEDLIRLFRRAIRE